MARSKSAPAKTTVSVTPGQNPPVKNVVRFEDLVAHAKKGAASPPARRGARSKAHDDALADVGKLAADLERALRRLRAASGEAAPRTRKAGARKRKS
jgi:hypothetical protein